MMDTTDDKQAAEERKIHYNKNKGSYSRRIKRMPKAFQDRFERFRKVGGRQWRYDYEEYELYVCGEACKLLAALPTASEVARFQQSSAEEREKMVPSIGPVHSGNTIAAAIALAVCYYAEPALIPRMHGALCPLVGCEKYGCYGASDAAARERGES